ncbi:alpha-amylase [Lachnospiraceae bacterium 62-35]
METYSITEDRRAGYPMGLTKTEKGFHFCAATEGEVCNLVLFRAGKEKPFQKIPFPQEGRLGNVWNMTIEGDSFDDIEYCYEADGSMFPDPYGTAFTGRDRWGSFSQIKRRMKSPVREEEFDWEESKPPEIPYSQMVVYRLHTRGFTKKAALEHAEKGTFRAVEEKIPYMKELGITTVELMPPTEFSEVIMTDYEDGSPYASKNEPTGKLNYWGYTKSYYFAPKAAFASGEEKNPGRELKELVKQLHKAGMELVIELYFTGKESPVFVLDVIRYWVREFRVDGVHLTGAFPTELLGTDPFLSRTKLWAVSWEGTVRGAKKHLGEYNDGFLVDMRRFLKGDEDMLNSIIFRIKRNPGNYGVINYIANTNGFTMADMVSYERKHNEKNGENGKDGTNYNYTWNCGVEGPTRKKKIQEMRKQQLRNAFLMVFLSQGTPLIMAGDEFGNSQNGNNNAYCQDNDISWLDWNLLKGDNDIYKFVKYVIAFRKRHPIFHMEEEPKILDYKACGYPDMSVHGVKAWKPEFESFRRQIGLMYCGDYAGEEEKRDAYFFVAYNMHWEPHEFALPNPPRKMKWHIAFNTNDSSNNGIYEEGKEPEVKGQKHFMVPPRAVVVFIGKKNIE